MKRLLIVPLTLVTFTSLYANELSWVDEQIEAIKPSRIGLDTKEIIALKDPFIFLHAKIQPQTVSPKKYTKYKRRVYRKKTRGFSLEAILNKSVLLNGKWYKLGAKVRGYTVTHIDSKRVILTRKKKHITLSLESHKHNLKISK